MKNTVIRSMFCGECVNWQMTLKLMWWLESQKCLQKKNSKRVLSLPDILTVHKDAIINIAWYGYWDRQNINKKE